MSWVGGCTWCSRMGARLRCPAFTLLGCGAAGERPVSALLEVPYVCRGFSLVLLSERRAVISVYSFREEEKVDWEALARDILADIEEFSGGGRVVEAILRRGARP